MFLLLIHFAVFSNGMVCELDNYVKLNRYGSSISKKIGLKQDKGFDAEYRAMAEIMQGKRKNDAIEATFAGHRLLIKKINDMKIKN